MALNTKPNDGALDPHPANVERSKQRGPSSVGKQSGVNSQTSRQPAPGKPMGSRDGVNNGVRAMQNPDRLPAGNLKAVNTNIKSRQPDDVPMGATSGPFTGVNEITSRQQGPKNAGNIANVNNVNTRQPAMGKPKISPKGPKFFTVIKQHKKKT